MKPTPIRVFIADDHPIVRQGLEVVINAQADMVLVGQAADGSEAVLGIAASQPDIAVLDLMMPKKNGLEVIREIKQNGWETKFLVLTSFPEDKMVISAIESGASGVLLKDSSPAQLMDAIRTVANGDPVLHPLVINKLMKVVQQSSATAAAQEVLTAREVEVLGCLARGQSNREIAAELSISTRTVTTHVRNILDKLELKNRTQAALYAVEHGMVEHPGG